MRRANPRALAAIDASFRIAPNPGWTEKGSDPQECAVWAKIAAPEVLNQDGKQHQARDDNRGCQPDIAKKIKHFDVGNQPVRCRHKVMNRLRRHRANYENKEAQ